MQLLTHNYVKTIWRWIFSSIPNYLGTLRGAAASALPCALRGIVVGGQRKPGIGIRRDKRLPCLPVTTILRQITNNRILGYIVKEAASNRSWAISEIHVRHAALAFVLPLAKWNRCQVVQRCRQDEIRQHILLFMKDVRPYSLHRIREDKRPNLPESLEDVITDIGERNTCAKVEIGAGDFADRGLERRLPRKSIVPDLNKIRRLGKVNRRVIAVVQCRRPDFLERTRQLQVASQRHDSDTIDESPAEAECASAKLLDIGRDDDGVGNGTAVLEWLFSECHKPRRLRKVDRGILAILEGISSYRRDLRRNHEIPGIVGALKV